MYTYVYIYTYMYIYTHIYIYVYTYAQNTSISLAFLRYTSPTPSIFPVVGPNGFSQGEWMFKKIQEIPRDDFFGDFLPFLFRAEALNGSPPVRSRKWDPQSCAKRREPLS